VKELIPKDILIFNWFWDWENGEDNDIKLQEMGFQQVYGNFRPEIQNWEKRSNRNSIIGGAPSSWAASTEFNFGKDLMCDFLGCANLLWSTHLLEKKELINITQDLMPQIRRKLSGLTLPSNDGNRVVPLEISKYYNTSSDQKIIGLKLSDMITGKIKVGNKIFSLADPAAHEKKNAIVVGTEGEGETSFPREVNGIKIGKDVSSLIFLQACAKPARNKMAYYYIYNFEDVADLLGWYEIVYEDGFVESVPIRYGVNILEWNMNSDNYCYFSDEVDCTVSDKTDPVTFFAYEWVNPRFGKKIKEINLKGTKNFTIGRNNHEKILTNNAIILKAISIVEKRNYK
jgi:hypothetical protein